MLEGMVGGIPEAYRKSYVYERKHFENFDKVLQFFKNSKKNFAQFI